jgi:hypothetical protein
MKQVLTFHFTVTGDKSIDDQKTRGCELLAAFALITNDLYKDIQLEAVSIGPDEEIL